MKKVIVIGCPGSGKSYFARKLRDKTGLPLFYLDQIWHKPDKTNISREDFDRKLEGILKKDQWIIDGNYARTLERRIQECDTVFLLDLPLDVCIQSAESRIGQNREDLPWVEDEFDEEFRQFILDFPHDTLPEIYDLLKQYEHTENLPLAAFPHHGDEKNIHIFRSREEVNKYIKKMEAFR